LDTSILVFAGMVAVMVNQISNLTVTHMWRFVCGAVGLEQRPQHRVSQLGARFNFV